MKTVNLGLKGFPTEEETRLILGSPGTERGAGGTETLWFLWYTQRHVAPLRYSNKVYFESGRKVIVSQAVSVSPSPLRTRQVEAL